MLGTLIKIALAVAGAFFIVSPLLRSRAKPLKAPSIGFLDLSGGEFSGLLTEDKAALAPLFGAGNVADAAGAIPCDVLFVYCRIEPDGRIHGSQSGLREVIRDCRSVIAVVASANPGAHCVAAGEQTGYGTANLVMTLDRRGSVFPEFFQRLFGLMKKGTTMPNAWVKLAPQIPDDSHPNCPEAIFACEVGAVSFR